MMKRSKTLLALTALVVAAAAMLGVYTLTRPETAAGQKAFTLEVVHGDGSARTFDLRTDHEYLAPALLDEELMSGEEGPYGLFITEVDGEETDSSRQQWWCLTQEHGQVFTSVETTPVLDGDKFELSLFTGYDIPTP